MAPFEAVCRSPRRNLFEKYVWNFDAKAQQLCASSAFPRVFRSFRKFEKMGCPSIRDMILKTGELVRARETTETEGPGEQKKTVETEPA